MRIEEKNVTTNECAIFMLQMKAYFHQIVLVNERDNCRYCTENDLHIIGFV